MLKHLLLSAAMLVPLGASAIVAYPGLVTVTQPDGTQLQVRLRGDEFHHIVLTEDNYLLAQKDGAYYYANTDAQGRTVASDILATPAAARPAAAKAYLQGVDMASVLKAQESQRTQAVETRTQALSQARQRMAAQAQAPDNDPDNKSFGLGLFPQSSYPCTGKQKGLVVLVQYTDVKFKTSYGDVHTYFTNMLNQKGFSTNNGTGSARDFFLESSNELFDIDFDVYGPVTLAHPMSYYGGNNAQTNQDDKPEYMAIEACQLLDDTVDFSQYDRDNDGYIDNIFVYYAGMGEANGGSANTVWPHSYNITAATSTVYKFDGVRLDRYACSNEWTQAYGTSRPEGVGTFIHEFSHVMGLPDLYATSYTTSFTPGAWSCMDVGPYNNEGRTPPLYGAFERNALKWQAPIPITGKMNVEMPAISSNEFYIINTSKSTEFFLLENRQKKSWDSYIPGHGMLVWHIDYSAGVWNNNVVNNTPSHQYVDIEEADGTQTPASTAGDAFPGTSKKTSFTDDTSPNMKTWAGVKLKLPLTDIKETNGVITFKVDGGVDPVDPIVAKDATDITPIGFTANWNKSDNAKCTGYLLNVYTKTDAGKAEYVDGYKALDVKDVDTYAVTGLTPATDYYYTVQPYTEPTNMAKASNEIAVRTGDPTFDYTEASVLPAEEVKDTSFTAKWEAMDGADSYDLYVCSKVVGNPFSDVCDFTDMTTAGLPDGWASSGKSTYSMASYSGNAVPSYRMAANGDWLRTPVYTDDVRGVSFWHREQKSDDENRLVVEALRTSDGTWVKLGEFYVPYDKNSEGQVETIEDITPGYNQLRFTFYRPSTEAHASGLGTLALDDVNVSWGGELNSTPLEAYNPARVGNVLECAVTGLQPETPYFYHVVAHKGNLQSLPSAEAKAVTTAKSGVDALKGDNLAGISVDGDMITAPADTAVEVYDVTGRRMATIAAGEAETFAPGFYVVRADKEAIKVVLK